MSRAHIRKSALRRLRPDLDLPPEVVDLIVKLTSSFVENIAAGGAELARHRGENVLNVQDLQLHVLLNYGIHIPGFDLLGSTPALVNLASGPTPSLVHQRRLERVKAFQAAEQKRRAQEEAAAAAEAAGADDKAGGGRTRKRKTRSSRTSSRR